MAQSTAPGPTLRQQQQQPAKPRVLPAIPHALTQKARAARSKAQSQSQSQSHSRAPDSRSSPAQTPQSLPGAASPATPVEPVEPVTSVPAPTAAPTAASTTPAPVEHDHVANGPVTPTASSSTPHPTGSSTQATSTADSGAIEDTPKEVYTEAGHAITIRQGPPATIQTNIHELPPPFYPANHASNPSSASTHRDPGSARQPHFHAPNGMPYLATRRESASSSPATGGLNPPPFPPQAAHTHAFAPGPSNPVLFPGHTHTLSEPFNGPSYPPPYFHHHGPPGLGFPPPVPVSFGQGRAPLSGMGHSATIRPDVTFSPRVSNTRAPPMGPTRGSNAYPSAGHAAGQPAFPANVDPKLAGPAEDAFALAHYLQSRLGNREFADHMMSISHSGYQLSQGTLPCHGVILARSPKLRSLMAMQLSEPSSFPKTLSLVISDRFINHDAIVARSISYLYAEPLLDRPFIEHLASQAPPDKDQAWERLRLSLAYAAMGHYLQVVPLVSRGIDLAASFLEWNNLSLALAFSLDGGLGASWSQSEFTGEDQTSSSSYDESKNESPASAPIYGIYSDRILNSIIQFLVTRFPVDFELAASAPQLVEAPRLPSIAEPRHARTGSRLDKIQFGEMSVDEERGLDPIRQQLSSVLVSLPLPLLKHVLEHPILFERLGSVKVATLMHTIIGEREQRRQRVQSRGQPGSTSSGLEERLWHATRWVERVERSLQPQPLNCGFRLARHREGNGHAPSSMA